MGPAPRGSLREASSGPPALRPSPGSSRPPPALPGRGAGRHGRLLASAPPRGQLPRPAGARPWPRVSTAKADSGRPAGSSSRPVRAPHHGRPGQSRRPRGLRSPRQHRGGGQLLPTSRSPASCEQSRAEGLRPPTRLGGGRLPRSWGGFRVPQSSVRGAGEGGLVAVARLWLGSAVRQGLAVQWRVPAGSRKEGGRGNRRRGSRAPAG